MEQNDYKQNPDKIGALWGKTSKNGEFFLSGIIEKGCEPGTRIVVFKVKEKSSEKAPDYKIMVSKPMVPNP